MTTITINPTASPTTSPARSGAPTRPTSSAAVTPHPRRRIAAWTGDVIGAVRRFLPTQSETPSDQAISTLSQSDRLGERR